MSDQAELVLFSDVPAEVPDGALSDAEVADLGILEDVVDRGRKSFVEVGQALLTIRDRRLYRTEYKTFEEYCVRRWDIRRGYADRVITAAQTVARITPIGVKPPESESQVRELTRLRFPDKQVEVWQAVVARSGADAVPITAKLVREEVERVMYPAAKPRTVSEPRETTEETRERTGVGVIHANEAINCLKEIPHDDLLRLRGYQIVSDFVKSNRSPQDEDPPTPESKNAWKNLSELGISACRVGNRLSNNARRKVADRNLTEAKKAVDRLRSLLAEAEKNVALLEGEVSQ